MMSSEKMNTGTFPAALRQLTRAEVPGTDSPDVLPRSLFWYPLIGLGIGLIAAVPVMMAIKYLRLMQGFVLFTSVIYLFLLEYIAGFRQMRQLIEICAMRSAHESAGTVCGMFLLIAKTVVLYLIFLRLALFGNLTALGIILIFTPAAARLLMLIPRTGKKTGTAGLTFALIAGGAFAAVLWTVVRISGRGLPLSSLSLWQIAPFFAQGVHDSIVLAGCCAIFWMVWHSEQKLLPQTPETALRMSGAYCETMELALQIGALILVDCIWL